MGNCAKGKAFAGRFWDFPMSQAHFQGRKVVYTLNSARSGPHEM